VIGNPKKRYRFPVYDLLRLREYRFSSVRNTVIRETAAFAMSCVTVMPALYNSPIRYCMGLC
jgi:hypothetical protein